MVKLYNFSSIPDNALLPVLQIAKRAARCRGNIVVKVTKGGSYTQSHAMLCDWVSKFFLSKRRYTKSSGKTELKKGRVYTDGGCVILSPRSKHDPLEFALDLFETVIHEFAHIRDRQDNKSFTDYNRQWKNRPHERRAIAATQDVMSNIEKQTLKREKCNEAILNLAIEVEKMEKGGKS